MYRQNHLIRLRTVSQSLVLVTEPKQLLFAVALANVHAEVDEGSIYRVRHSVRVSLVRRTFNGHGTMVIRRTGRTPGAVFLFYTERDSAVITDTVVAACLPGRTGEATADTLRRKLTDYTVRGNTVNRMIAGTVFVR